MILNFLLWCLFGLIAGAIAQAIMPGRDVGQTGNARGFVITTFLGIVGAVVGGYLASQLFNWDLTGFSLQSMAVAILGALLVLALYRMIAPAARRPV